MIVHLYNLDTTDRHSFTIGAPYNIDKDLAPGQHSTITFKATEDGALVLLIVVKYKTRIGQ